MPVGNTEVDPASRAGQCCAPLRVIKHKFADRYFDFRSLKKRRVAGHVICPAESVCNAETAMGCGIRVPVRRGYQLQMTSFKGDP